MNEIQPKCTLNVKQPVYANSFPFFQNLAIPRLLERKNSLCAAETGSGKTLAYLLPIIQYLLSESKPPQSVVAQAGSPRVLVIVPARELAQQVFVSIVCHFLLCFTYSTLKLALIIKFYIYFYLIFSGLLL